MVADLNAVDGLERRPTAPFSRKNMHASHSPKRESEWASSVFIEGKLRGGDRNDVFIPLGEAQVHEALSKLSFPF